MGIWLLAHKLLICKGEFVYHGFQERFMTKQTDDNRQEDVLRTYFGQIKMIPLLAFEEELELSRRIQRGDELARQKLIESNLRLVVKIAKGFVSADVPLLDLIQEGNLGLIHAAQKYDYAKNVRFSTYANWWIKQAITRSLANKRRAIRLPHRKEEALKKGLSCLVKSYKYTDLTNLPDAKFVILREPTASKNIYGLRDKILNYYVSKGSKVLNSKSYLEWSVLDKKTQEVEFKKGVLKIIVQRI